MSTKPQEMSGIKLDKMDTPSKRAFINRLVRITKGRHDKYDPKFGNQTTAVSRNRQGSTVRETINQALSDIERSLSPEERALLSDYELQLAMALSLSLKDQETT